MGQPKPVYLGSFGPFGGGDTPKRYIDLDGSVGTGITISSTTFSAVDSDGTAISNPVSGATYSTTQVHFQITCPETADTYTVTAVSTTSDSQELTHTFEFIVV